MTWPLGWECPTAPRTRGFTLVTWTAGRRYRGTQRFLHPATSGLTNSDSTPNEAFSFHKVSTLGHSPPSINPKPLTNSQRQGPRFSRG